MTLHRAKACNFPVETHFLYEKAILFPLLGLLRTRYCSGTAEDPGAISRLQAWRPLHATSPHGGLF